MCSLQVCIVHPIVILEFSHYLDNVVLRYLGFYISTFAKGYTCRGLYTLARLVLVT